MYTYRLNAFTEINTNKKFLKALQPWNTNYIKDNKISDKDFNKEIEININLSNFSLKEIYWKTSETWYFKKRWNTYYRNCFSSWDIKWWKIYYSWFFSIPWQYMSNMICEINMSDIISVNIKISPLYLLESRSRITKNQSFEWFLSDLIYVLSILKWKIPMHAAAVDTDKWWVLLMWLPNTWKTTTSNLIKNELKWKLISEDITFIDLKTKKIISSPFTSKENIPDIHISKWKLKYIITLYRDNQKRWFLDFVMWNNLYEFSLLKDINIKTLFLYWSKNFPWLKDIEEIYNEWIKDIIKHSTEIETTWIEMLDYKKYLVNKLK